MFYFWKKEGGERQMGHYKAVVFDLDGTLLDTLEDLTDSVNAALLAFGGSPKSIEQIRAYVGNGIRNLMLRCVEGGEDHPEFEQIFQAFREHYKHNSRNKTKPYDGVTELLRTLKNDGYLLAIVSNKADFAVKDLNAYYFKEFGMAAVGEREGVARKPAPDAVWSALNELGVSPEQAVYVGDSEVDVKTAANANLPCISVLWGFREKQFLKEHGAVCFAETAGDIPALLEKI